jgi:hypothetical protein
MPTSGFDRDQKRLAHYPNPHICSENYIIIQKIDICILLTWKYLVWYRVKAHPIRKSSSCRASTESDMLRLGFPSSRIAFFISVSEIDEKCALNKNNFLDLYIIKCLKRNIPENIVHEIGTSCRSHWRPHRLDHFETNVLTLFVTIQP